jgi:hypothetical protein
MTLERAWVEWALIQRPLVWYHKQPFSSKACRSVDQRLQAPDGWLLLDTIDMRATHRLERVSIGCWGHMRDLEETMVLPFPDQPARAKSKFPLGGLGVMLENGL